jgi:hypothetical protein
VGKAAISIANASDAFKVASSALRTCCCDIRKFTCSSRLQNDANALPQAKKSRMMHPTRAAALLLVEKWSEFLRTPNLEGSHTEPPPRTLSQPEMLPLKRRQFSHPTMNGSAFRADVARNRQAAPDSAHHSLLLLPSP